MATIFHKLPRQPNLSLQDRSMHAYDNNAIPSLTLRRPRTPTPTRHTITHLVKAHDVQLAVEHLRTITLTDPTTLAYIVHAIRKHLLPRPTRKTKNPTHPLTLIHQLVRTVPYFYRYIAYPSFFRGFWRLQTDPASSLSVRLLVAAWARDLSYMHHHNDPAAAFWVLTHRRLAQHIEFPIPPPRTRFVHRVSPFPAKKLLHPAQQFPHEDVAATLRLMDTLKKATADQPEPSCLRHQSATLRVPPVDFSSIPDSGSHKELADFTCPCPCPSAPKPQQQGMGYGRKYELNEKLLAVLRRHDDLCGRSDPYFLAPPTRIFEWDSNGTLPFSYSRFSRSSTSTPRSVAALARENARRKLSESQMSLSTSYRGGNSLEAESFLEELTIGEFEPSTFADIEVEDGEVCYEYVQEERSKSPLPDYAAAIESVGDTVILPPGFGMEQMLAGEAPVVYGGDSSESRQPVVAAQ